MKQAYKKRPPRATANSPPVLLDRGGILFYKSGKFIYKQYLSVLLMIMIFHHEKLHW